MAHVEETLMQFDVLDALARDYIDVEERVLALDKDNWWLPFTKWFDKAHTQPARSMRYDWALASDNPMYITVSSQAVANTFVVAATASLNGIHVGDVLFSNDGSTGADEWMIVDSITDSTTFVCYNVSGQDDSGTGGRYTSGDILYVAGTVQAEGGRAGRVVYDISTAYNYLQSFAVQIERSDFAMLTHDRLGDAQFQRKQATLEFLKRQELAYIFGDRAEDTGYGGSGRPSDGNLYLTGGLQEYIPSGNITSLSTAELDMESWREWLRDGVKYGGGQKIIYAGLDFYDDVWTMYKNETNFNIQINPNNLGFEVFRVPYMGHIITITPHPALVEDLSRRGYLWDPDYMFQKVALPYSLRNIPMVEYDKDRYKLKSIRGLKPMNENVLHQLTITE